MRARLEAFPLYAATTVLWSPERMAALIEQGEAAGVREAGLARSHGVGAQSSRQTSIAWVPHEAAEAWVRELQGLAQTLNERYWHFDLEPLAESLQYTVYEPGDYFGWHTDAGPGVPPRKLSISVQLTEPSEYDGGELQVQMTDQLIAMPRQAGQAIVFPSFVRHRVTPVTRGVRRALVAWIGGPPFR